jgi:hypothetical protein
MHPNKRKPVKGDKGLPKFLQDSTTMMIDNTIQLDNTEKLDDYLAQKQNKERFNEVLKQTRLKREKTKRI